MYSQSSYKIQNFSRYIIFHIIDYLELQDAIPLIFTGKHFIQTIRYSEYGQNQLKRMIKRELGIINDFQADKEYFQNIRKEIDQKQQNNRNQNVERNDLSNDRCGKIEDKLNSFYDDFENCLQVYEQKLKWWSPQYHRIFGFKTSGGVDKMSSRLSVSNLFIPHSGHHQAFSSDIAKNILATGVFLNEDLDQLLANVEKKVQFFMGMDLKSIKRDFHQKEMKCLLQMRVFMQFQQIAPETFYEQAQYREWLLKPITHLIKKEMIITSETQLKEEIIKRALQYSNEGKEFNSLFVYGDHQNIDNAVMQEMKHKNNHYYELRHKKQIHDCEPVYYLIDQIKINLPQNFTCPAKTLAVFVHNQDIDYFENETVKLLDNCITIKDLIELRNKYPDIIPKFYHCSLNEENGLAMQNATVIFDQSMYLDSEKTFNIKNPLRLILWTKFVNRATLNTTIVRFIIFKYNLRNFTKRQHVDLQQQSSQIWTTE
ncbi:UNKNOWN [Stylonychia lemnae]|uniref:Uncharacterized protein n=1 Tax=Stylonychia lemnae TaxID=5949 RepID=A0A078AUH3_STYLE|nr:UNKNOWN [Stylonychia lemnae]|eukprot:CDW86045.1 UNKNOWN [Stylonychia lemnae]